MKRSENSSKSPTFYFSLLAAALFLAAVLLFLLLRFWISRHPFEPPVVLESYQEVRGQLLQLEEAALSGRDAFSPEELPDVLDAAALQADEYLHQGLLERYVQEEGCLYMELPGGVGYVYTPPVENLQGGTAAALSLEALRPQAAAPEAAGDGSRKSILTIEPTPSDANLLANYLTSGRSPDQAARQVAEALPDDYVFDRNLDAFLPESVQELTSHSVILWYGHGGYTTEHGPSLEISTPVDLAGLETYQTCFANQEFLLGDEHFHVTAKFFEEHLEDGALEGSLVYLAPCHSVQDTRMAEVLIQKGADLVAGTTNGIFIRYNLFMLTDFFTALTNRYEDGSYWTAEDALAWARSQNGETDSLFYHAQVGLCYPHGEQEYRLIPLAGEEEAAGSPPTLAGDSAPVRYLNEAILPQYPAPADTLEISFRQFEGAGGGNVWGFQGDRPQLAYLGCRIQDYNGDGTEDLLTVTLDLDRTSPYDQYLAEAPDYGNLVLTVRLYCFEEGNSQPSHTFSYYSGIYPYAREERSLAAVGDFVVLSQAYEDDQSSGEEPYGYQDRHQDELRILFWEPNEEKDLILRSPHYIRTIGHVGLEEAVFVSYKKSEDSLSPLEEFFFRGATGLTRREPDGTTYDPPRIQETVSGQVSTEQEACDAIHGEIQEILGEEAFAIAPASWEGRWEDSFLPEEDAFPQVRLEMTTPNTRGGLQEGTLTLAIRQRLE